MEEKKLFSLSDIVDEVLKNKGIDLDEEIKDGKRGQTTKQKEFDRIKEKFTYDLKKIKNKNKSWYDIGKKNAANAKKKHKVDKRVNIAFFEDEKKELKKIFKESTRIQQFLDKEADIKHNNKTSEEIEIEEMRDAYFNYDVIEAKVKNKTEKVLKEWVKAQEKKPLKKDIKDKSEKIYKILLQFENFTKEEQEEIDEEAENAWKSANEYQYSLDSKGEKIKVKSNKKCLEIDKVLRYEEIMYRREEYKEFEKTLEIKEEEALNKLTNKVLSKFLRMIVDIDEEDFKKDIEEEETALHYGKDVWDIEPEDLRRQNRLKEADNYFRIKEEWQDVFDFIKAKAKEWKEENA